MRQTLLELPADIYSYAARADEIRRTTTSILDAVGITEPRHVLELGPALGASLGVFRQRRAKIRFVERHPVFAASCWIHGYRGGCFDYVRHRRWLPANADLVYARGSFTPSYFTGQNDFSDWLARLGGGSLILCPWLDGATPPWFSATLIRHGCQPQGWIDGFSVEGIYPEVWVRNRQ